MMGGSPNESPGHGDEGKNEPLALVLLERDLCRNNGQKRLLTRVVELDQLNQLNLLAGSHQTGILHTLETTVDDSSALEGGSRVLNTRNHFV